MAADKLSVKQNVIKAQRIGRKECVGDDPPLGSDAQFVTRRTVDGPPAEERLARRNLRVVRRGDRRHRTAGDILLDDFAGDHQE